MISYEDTRHTMQQVDEKHFAIYRTTSCTPRLKIQLNLTQYTVSLLQKLVDCAI